MYNRLKYNHRTYNETSIFRVLIAQTVAVVDVIGKVASYLRTIVDPVNVADSFSIAMAFVKSIVSTIPVTQTITRTATFFRNIFDNFNISDNLVSRVLDKLGAAPTIFSASRKRFFAGSSKIIRPKRS